MLARMYALCVLVDVHRRFRLPPLLVRGVVVCHRPVFSRYYRCIILLLSCVLYLGIYGLQRTLLRSVGCATASEMSWI
jgi:hypothetical protein